MRATHQIVRANAVQVLAEVATLVEATTLVAATRMVAQPVGLPVVPRVALMVRAPALVQIARVATVLPRIVRAAMVTARTLHALRVMAIRARVATATGRTRRVPPAMAIRGHAATVIHGHAAMVIRAHRARAEIDPIQLVRHVTAIRVHVVTATARTRRARVAMATVLVARRAQVATGHTRLVRPALAIGPIPHAHRATARARIAPMAIARAPIDRGMTGLAQTGRGAIDPMATDPAATGSPRAVSDVRSARR